MLSRVADSLYWLSRYLERAEHTARLIDVQTHLMLDLTPEAAAERWLRVLECLQAEPEANTDAYRLMYKFTFDTQHNDSIASCVHNARENACQLREHISSEMWMQINREYLEIKDARMDNRWASEPHAFFMAVKEGIHLFQGITDSTMNYNEGYHFIQVGRYIERAAQVARLLDVFYRALRTPDGHYVDDYLQWMGVLKSCTAFEAYCKVYTANLRAEHIAEFMILNAEFPHSLGFATDRIQTALATIAQQTNSRRARTVNRLAGRMASVLDFRSVDELFAVGLHDFLSDITGQCARIHDAIFQTYVAYSVEQEFGD